MSILDRVMARAVDTLQGWGQELSSDHLEALHLIASRFCDDVESTTPIKLAIGLDTGLGKTTLLASFLNVLKEEGIHYPALVCVPTIKALEDMMDYLSSYTDEEKGCKHSDAECRYPSTPNESLNKKQVLVTCHARADSTRDDWDTLIKCGDDERTIFYDEALKRGKSIAFQTKVLRSQLHTIQIDSKDDVKEYLLNLEYRLEVTETDEIIDITCPEVVRSEFNSLVKEYIRETGRETDVDYLTEIASGHYDSIRRDGADTFTFRHTFPSVKSLFVLDANHPYSILSQLDESIEVLDIPNFKAYDDVIILSDGLSRGKHAIGKNLDTYLQWARDKVEEAKAQGQNPAVIYFKDHYTKVKEALPDVDLIQWGKHAGSNGYRDKDAIICIGILQVRDEDAKGQITLYANNIKHPVNNYTEVAEGEAFLNLYQAVSRGASRKVYVKDGYTKACPSTIYLPGKLSSHQVDMMRKVMPMVKYQVASHYRVVMDILRHIGDQEGTISTKKLAKAIPSFNDLVQYERDQVLKELEAHGWRREGRSITKGGLRWISEISL